MYFISINFPYKVRPKAKFLNQTIKNLELELPLKINYAFTEKLTRYLTKHVKINKKKKD